MRLTFLGQPLLLAQLTGQGPTQAFVVSTVGQVTQTGQVTSSTVSLQRTCKNHAHLLNQVKFD